MKPEPVPPLSRNSSENDDDAYRREQQPLEPPKNIALVRVSSEPNAASARATRSPLPGKLRGGGVNVMCASQFALFVPVFEHDWPSAVHLTSVVKPIGPAKPTPASRKRHSGTTIAQQPRRMGPPFDRCSHESMFARTDQTERRKF